MEKIIGRYCFITLVSVVFIGTIMRYAGMPLGWTTELAQLLFVWIIFMGADLALRKKGHIGIDALVNLLPLKLRYVIYFAMQFILLVFLTVLVYYGFYLSIDNLPRRFQTLGISYSFATVGVPIGSLLMIRTIIERLIQKDILPKS